MTDLAAASRIAADILAHQHMRADRSVQDMAPLAREYQRLVANRPPPAPDLGPLPAKTIRMIVSDGGAWSNPIEVLSDD